MKRAMIIHLSCMISFVYTSFTCYFGSIYILNDRDNETYLNKLKRSTVMTEDITLVYSSIKQTFCLVCSLGRRDKDLVYANEDDIKTISSDFVLFLYFNQMIVD